MLKAWNQISGRPEVLRLLKKWETESALPIVRFRVSELADYADWLGCYQHTLDANDLSAFLSKLNDVERDAVHVLMSGDRMAKARVKRKIRSSLMRTTRMIDKAVQQVENKKNE